ncbi:tRNA-specific adenosine deaminase 1 [Lentinula edodes]|uniref:tRNA-specific adenosine deaminase 1 n=1 Tax=Lentinula edodes TaxID=5353 RepID=A0A1Q3EBM1_LENED|nr:tRNA-specific adenosine deaminase 1 [Lentinula edodes]
MNQSSPSDDDHIALIHTLYSQLKLYPQPSQYTILSALYLTSSTSSECKIISLGTGTKCLPKCRLPIRGEAVHDSHAEVVARRGAIRWILEETIRERVQGSGWIERHADKYRFRKGIQIRIDKIASWSWLGIQGAFGAKLFEGGTYIQKIIIGEVLPSRDVDLIKIVKEDCERALGGRLEGLLPTDQGPCSLQKPVIAFTPVPFIHSRLVVGLTSTSSNESLCWHADSIPPQTLPAPPQTLLSSSSFFPDSDHFRNSPSDGTVQVLINGYKRGVSPKHRQKMQNSKFIPQVSKLSILRLYARVCKEVYGVEIPSTQSYHETKTDFHDLSDHQSANANVLSTQPVSAYHEAKILLKGPSAPFSAWWDKSTRSLVPTPSSCTGSEDVSSSNGKGKEEWTECARLNDETDITREERLQCRGSGYWERFNVDGELPLERCNQDVHYYDYTI